MTETETETEDRDMQTDDRDMRQRQRQRQLVSETCRQIDRCCETETFRQSTCQTEIR